MKVKIGNIVYSGDDQPIMDGGTLLRPGSKA
jgi:hypothetical protein